MEQYTENQYDDDLTDSSGEYDDSYYTGAEDLFDYTPDEESPISRLKSLVLSIDWEITDDVLMEFNEELVDLKDIWAGEKINLVYVQALEKLSKYIYQKKAESHPSAIKLLLTLYHNLEKIVTSDELDDSEKKAILLEDVKRFENLKSHLKTPSRKQSVASLKPVVEEITPPDNIDGESELINLKAIVLGIDWEITDDDLSALRKEVIRLESLFAGSRPKLILLQGIGTIGAYIKVKKSDSHADAFKVLHLFYESLERVVDSPMTVEEEKAVLFPAVEKFNQFKSLLGETISPEKIGRKAQNSDDDAPGVHSGAITPAFSDMPDDDVVGFQADKEAAALGIENPDNVNDHVANFFGEDSFVDERVPVEETPHQLAENLSVFADAEVEEVDMVTALQGVDVEEGDEEEDNDKSPVAFTDDPAELTPALASDDTNDESPASEFSDGPVALGIDEESVLEDAVDELPVEVVFPDADEVVADFGSIDKNVALQGVDVESEADDDSDEDALPLLEGELAPALADNDEVSIFNAEKLESTIVSEGLDDQIAGTVLDFFEEESPKEQIVAHVDEETIKTPLPLDEDLSFEPDTVAEISTDTPVDLPGSYDEFDAIAEDTKGEISDNKSEDISTDIEDQLDDFFGSDDFDDDETSDDMFASIGLSASDDNDVVESVKDQGDVEEVIFELVEESPEQLENPTDVTATAIVAGASVVAAISSEGEFETQIESEPSVTDSVEQDVISLDEADTASFGKLDNLAACIEAAGLELEDKVITGLLDEINVLDDQWSGKPLDKTFLHLLRTLGIHIDRYRYEAGSDAYSLLKSVYDALELSQTAIEQKEELLLAQTVRVLDWQQDIIKNDGRKSADSTKRREPLFVQELGNPSDEMLTFEDDFVNELETMSDGIEAEPSAQLKDEISSLRKSLQDEISELKKSQ